MKKKILSAILLSGMTLTTMAQISPLVNANDIDAKIAAKDAAIGTLTREQSAAKVQVASVQAQVSSLEAQQSALTEENNRLQQESKVLAEEITVLSEKIVARSASLENQARSAQKNNTATNYISTILNSESVSDAISRVVAIRKVVAANEKMLAQQEADKVSIEEKQKANQEAINTVWENQAKLQDTAMQLNTQKAALEVAQLNLAAELATAEGEKAALLDAKAQAEVAARAAAEAEAAARAQAKAQAEAQAASIAAAKPAVIAKPTVSPTVAPTAVIEKVAEVKPVVATPESAAAPTASPASNAVTSSSVTASINTAGNTYPIGQCTWGVKSLASWVGSYWGNASQWGASAQAAGHAIGSVPVAGAVAVWPYDGGGYGHVAYVTAVESATNIQVMESNFAGSMSIGNYRGWFNPTDATWGGGSVYYIYP